MNFIYFCITSAIKKVFVIIVILNCHWNLKCTSCLYFPCYVYPCPECNIMVVVAPFRMSLSCRTIFKRIDILNTVITLKQPWCVYNIALKDQRFMLQVRKLLGSGLHLCSTDVWCTYRLPSGMTYETPAAWNWSVAAADNPCSCYPPQTDPFGFYSTPQPRLPFFPDMGISPYASVTELDYNAANGRLSFLGSQPTSHCGNGVMGIKDESQLENSNDRYSCLAIKYVVQGSGISNTNALKVGLAVLLTSSSTPYKLLHASQNIFRTPYSCQ